MLGYDEQNRLTTIAEGGQGVAEFVRDANGVRVVRTVGDVTTYVINELYEVTVDTSAAPARVTAGLQALYDFDEGSGTTVADSSGVGTPLDLTIATPANVTWGTGFLDVTGDTLISSAGAATKIVDAVKLSDEITVEAWIADPLYRARRLLTPRR